MAPNSNMQDVLNRSGSAEYYNKGSAEAATESALTLAKIQMVRVVWRPCVSVILRIHFLDTV